MKTNLLHLAALVLCPAWVAQAQLSSLLFNQTSFDQGAYSVPNSSWGLTTFDYSSASTISYFNLVVNGTWRVQNAPLLGSSGSIGINFNLSGLPTLPDGSIGSFSYFATMDLSPAASMPVGTAAGASVSPYTVTVGGRGLGGPVGFVGSGIFGWLPVGIAVNTGMVNQDCGVDECEPTAFSNSLNWLKNNGVHGMPADQISIGAMKIATSWGAPSVDVNGKPIPGTGGAGTPGVLEGGDVQGKRAAVAGGGITTSTLGANAVDDLISRLNNGEDVEILGTGHAAVVTGVIKHADGTVTLRVAHDTQQGEDGGTIQQLLGYDPATGQVTSGAYGFPLGSKIDGFVAEVPEPSSAALLTVLGTLLALARRGLKPCHA
jgi:hypothetical protein